jgi:hypothetical protein
MHRISWCALLPAFSLSQACDLTGPASAPTELFVQNVSAFAMSDLVVNEWEIGELQAGGRAGPRLFSTVYSYGAIGAVVLGDTLRIQPIDFVGEEPLGRGEFTYVLSVGGDERQRWLILETVAGAPD